MPKKKPKELLIYRREMKSPLGIVSLFTNQTHLIALSWQGISPRPHGKGVDFVLSKNHNSRALNILKQTEVELTEYFESKRKTFSVPLAPHGTPFQQVCWKVLQSIPYGETISYQKQAQILGDPNKQRAVGQANGKNPLPILIPCHRVIAKNGQLRGFSAGTEKKAFLLQLEQAIF